MKCRDNTVPGLFRIIIGYIPVLSDCVLVATLTFKIRSDPGVVTRNFAHEFVQELWGRHRGCSFPCRSFFWRCQAGRDKHKNWSEKDIKGREWWLWWERASDKQKNQCEISNNTLTMFGRVVQSHPKHQRSLILKTADPDVQSNFFKWPKFI